ncbi:MAG: ABC transporter permease [Acidobacteriota bacterium]|nr:MAG: ABC transporter permease [Acidobacteriota bacterium]
MISARTRTVFKKEVVDNVRDRRTLAAALFYPVLGPAMILFMIFAIGQMTRESEQPLMLPVQGVDNAPNLIAFLEQNRVTIEAAPDDPERAVRRGDEDVVLIIPEDFGESFTDGRPATVRLVMDQSRNEAMRAIQRAQMLVQAYGHQIGRLRLQVRGVDPRVADAIAIEAVDVSTPQSQAARILSMAPYLILVSLFVGGMYLAIDSTAGERERGSLEPLLINPVERSELVKGKAAAVLVFTTVALIETLIGFAIILNFFPLERYIGVRMSLPPASLGAILLICLPLMVFVVALQMIIASYTKSFKEAQNYISFMLLVPAVPALIMAVLPVKESLWLVLLPTVGQQLFINQILRGEPVSLGSAALGSAVTLAAGIALLVLVTRRYRTEGILFH